LPPEPPAPCDPVDDTLAAADTEVADASIEEPSRGVELSPGARIGRFTVVGSLGRGGMGTVVSAHDPDLDRQVAIKLVSRGAGSFGEEARERLVREARALAKLRHRNVVAVYEVGEHEGQVYLAMERVEGGTLRRALRDLGGGEHTPWRQILDLFVAAGRGLAAAHASGMVHRDFKPENVLVDADGRILVVDFGLVGTTGELTGLDTGGGASVHDRLTRHDVVMGTPAYMAPEQHLGMPVDARADQFAFCVALYEALYGALPFEGNTRKRYVGAMTRGELRPIPAERKIPRWLHETLARGLAPDPAARFSSMEALLAELGADPHRLFRLGQRERMLGIGGGVLVVAAWGGVLLGLGVELSYTALYASNLGFLLLSAIAAVAGRRAFARTTFNLQALSLSLAIGATLVTLVVGGHLLAIPPQALGVLHLIVLGGIMVTAAIALNPKFGLSAAVYFVGFLIAAAWPHAFFVVVLVGHLIVGANLYVILGSRGSWR
jgi:hypothetical protein